jgi:hypothetical protein
MIQTLTLRSSTLPGSHKFIVPQTMLPKPKSFSSSINSPHKSSLSPALKSKNNPTPQRAGIGTASFALNQIVKETHTKYDGQSGAHPVRSAIPHGVAAVTAPSGNTPGLSTSSSHYEIPLIITC